MSTRNDGTCSDCGELSPVRFGRRCTDCHDDYQQETIDTLKAELRHTNQLYDQAKAIVGAGKDDDLLATLEELVAQNNRLEQQQQDDVDAIVHYRNLAIALGATPDEMMTPYDRQLAETKTGIDRVDYDRHQWWQEVYALEAEVERWKTLCLSRVQMLNELNKVLEAGIRDIVADTGGTISARVVQVVRLLQSYLGLVTDEVKSDTKPDNVVAFGPRKRLLEELPEMGPEYDNAGPPEG